MIQYIINITSISAFVAGLIIMAVATFELANPSFRFWPPPKDEPWKKFVFMTLFRVLVYGLIISSFLHLWQNGLSASRSSITAAILLVCCGFAIAFSATFALGWKNAFGSKEGLKTEGIFKYSRNPIYVATWFGLAGWALLIPSPFVSAALLCWSLIYVVAIFIEERWLKSEYGEPFLEYCRDVRRFF